MSYRADLGEQRAYLESRELSFEISDNSSVWRGLAFLGLPVGSAEVSAGLAPPLLDHRAPTHLVCFNFRASFCVSNVRDFLSALCSSLTAWNCGKER